MTHICLSHWDRVRLIQVTPAPHEARSVTITCVPYTCSLHKPPSSWHTVVHLVMGVIQVIHVYLLHKLLCPATLYPGVCHLHTNRWPLPDPRSASLTRICVLRASVHVQDCVPSVHWITLFTCAPMIPSTTGPSTPVPPLVTTQGLRSEHFRLLFTPKTSLNCHFKCRNAAKQAVCHNN